MVLGWISTSDYNEHKYESNDDVIWGRRGGSSGSVTTKPLPRCEKCDNILDWNSNKQLYICEKCVCNKCLKEYKNNLCILCNNYFHKSEVKACDCKKICIKCNNPSSDNKIYRFSDTKNLYEWRLIKKKCKICNNIKRINLFRYMCNGFILYTCKAKNINKGKGGVKYQDICFDCFKIENNRYIGTEIREGYFNLKKRIFM